jgi:predicted PurR-regulated permease PerM
MAESHGAAKAAERRAPDPAHADPAHRPGDANPRSGIAASVMVLAVLGAIAALYAGRAFCVPVALAIVLAAALTPLVRMLKRVRLSPPVSAAIIVLAMVGVFVLAGVALDRPAQRWMDEAPRTIAAARAKLDRLRRPLQRLTGGQGAASRGGGPAPGSPPRADSAPARPQPAQPQGQSGGQAGGQISEVPRIAARALGTSAGVLAGAAEVLLLLYFLLAGDDRFLRQLVHELPNTEQKRTAVEVAREAESVVGRYLSVTAVINLGQGAAVGLAMWAIGLPNPWLWGAVTVVLEFLPYAGAALMIALLAVVGLATFDSPGRALLAPGLYLLISTLQNNLVSPVAYGRRLGLNPFAVLVAVLFWGTLWGVAGIFVAVPMAAALRVLAERVPSLTPVAAFLGE